jgi:hypothetical protein
VEGVVWWVALCHFYDRKNLNDSFYFTAIFFKMKYKIARYSFEKEFITTGILNIKSSEQQTILNFIDNEIELEESAFYHPMAALENLRNTLEKKYQSLINCNGCRRDTAYRFTGGYGTYEIEFGKQATKDLHLFEPTTKIEMLCKVDEHIAAYNVWLNSLLQKC